MCMHMHTHTHTHTHTHARAYIFKHHNPVTIQYKSRSYIETAIFICLYYMSM